MYFSWRPEHSIGLTESVDGITWSTPRRVFAPDQGETGWGIETEVNRPSVVCRNGQYHMWYTSQSESGASAGRSWIGYAISDDGVAWRRQSAAPMLAPILPWENVAVMCPHVIWDDLRQIWMMWYSAGEQYEPNAIGYAVSDDGITWTRHADHPIFSADSRNRWEQHKVTACQVVFHDGCYWMFYVGFENEHRARIGLARSLDGISNWERSPFNPLISPEAAGWDQDACYKPYAVLDGDRWLLWYNGRHGDSEQIGRAELPQRSLAWD